MLLILHSQEKYLLRLLYNESNSFLFVNAIKVYQFKAKKHKNKRLCTLYKSCFKRFCNL